MHSRFTFFWWRAAALAALLPFLAPAQSGEVRLAVAPGDDAPLELIDLLTAHLSTVDKVAVLERAELDRVVREQNLDVTMGTQALQLGRILRADGLLMVSRRLDGLLVRIVAVNQGVVIDRVQVPAAVTDMQLLAQQVGRRFQEVMPKLKVGANSAIRISLLNVTSPIKSASALAVRREIAGLLMKGLLNQPEVFVLERRHLGKLAAEKDFGDQTTRFWVGSYLLDGEFNSDGGSLEDIHLKLRLARRGSGERRFSVTGQRTKLPELMNQAVNLIVRQITGKPPEDAWSARTEAIRYHEEARFAKQMGAPDLMAAATEAAWALGLRNDDLRRLRLESLIRDVSSAERKEPGSLSPWLSVPPQPEALERARLALEFFQDQSRGDAMSNDRTWYYHGMRALSQATKQLRLYYFAVEYRRRHPDELADLRRACREVEKQFEEYLGRVDHRVSDNLSSEIRRFHHLRFHSGRFWSEGPRENVAWLEQLIASSSFTPSRLDTYYQGQPRLVSWRPSQWRGRDELWRQLEDRWRQSTNIWLRTELKLKALQAVPAIWSERQLQEQTSRLQAQAFRDRSKVGFSRTYPRYAPQELATVNRARDELVRELWEHRHSLFALPDGNDYWRSLTNRMGTLFSRHRISADQIGTSIRARAEPAVDEPVADLIKRIEANRDQLVADARDRREMSRNLSGLERARNYLLTAENADSGEYRTNVRLSFPNAHEASYLWPALKTYGERFNWPFHARSTLSSISMAGVEEAKETLRKTRPSMNLPPGKVRSTTTNSTKSGPRPSSSILERMRARMESRNRRLRFALPASPIVVDVSATAPVDLELSRFVKFPLERLSLPTLTRPPRVEKQLWFYQAEAIWVAVRASFQQRKLLTDRFGVSRMRNMTLTTNVIACLSTTNEPQFRPIGSQERDPFYTISGDHPTISVASTKRWVYRTAPTGLYRQQLDNPNGDWERMPELDTTMGTGRNTVVRMLGVLRPLPDRLVLCGPASVVELTDDAREYRLLASTQRRMRDNPLDNARALAVTGIVQTPDGGYVIANRDGRIFSVDSQRQNWVQQFIPGQPKWDGRQRPEPHQLGATRVSGGAMIWHRSRDLAEWNPSASKFDLLYSYAPDAGSKTPPARWTLPNGLVTRRGLVAFSSNPVRTEQGVIHALRVPRFTGPATRPIADPFPMELCELRPEQKDLRVCRIALRMPKDVPSIKGEFTPTIDWLPGGLVIRHPQDVGFWLLRKAEIERLFSKPSARP